MGDTLFRWATEVRGACSWLPLLHKDSSDVQRPSVVPTKETDGKHLSSQYVQGLFGNVKTVLEKNLDFTGSWGAKDAGGNPKWYSDLYNSVGKANERQMADEGSGGGEF